MKEKTLIEKAEIVAKKLEKVTSKKKAVGFTIKVSDKEVTVECGRDYPDSVANKVFNAFEKAGLAGNQYSCCAEVSGGNVLKTIYVNGGKSDRRWWK
jgi:hypothetical protein